MTAYMGAMTAERLLRQSVPSSTAGSPAGVPLRSFSVRTHLHALPEAEARVLLGILLGCVRRRRRQVMASDSDIRGPPDTSWTFSNDVREKYVSPVLRVLNFYRHPSLPELTVRTGTVLEDAGVRLTLHTSTPRNVHDELDVHAEEHELSAPLPIVLLFLAPGQLSLEQWRLTEILPSPPCTSTHAILAEVAEDLASGLFEYAFITDTQVSVVLGGYFGSQATRKLPLAELDQVDFNVAVCCQHERNLPLRLLLAAYIYASVSRAYMDHNHRPIAPETKGAPNQAQVSRSTDEELNDTRRRHSDFDQYALETDAAQAAQFFRWRITLDKNIVRGAAAVGDVITAETNGFFKRHMASFPRYPLVRLPGSTRAYMQEAHRSGPWSVLSKVLEQSRQFSLRVTQILDGGQAHAIVVRLISIEGVILEDAVLTDAELCIKLYDDSLFQLNEPVDEADAPRKAESVRYYRAENFVRREDAAYRRLEHAQGSLVPQYFGAHLFTLKNGYELYGTMMEFVHGEPLRQAACVALPDEAQISLIQSARHGVRALFYADCSQLDWHSDQLLFYEARPGDDEFSVTHDQQRASLQRCGSAGPPSDEEAKTSLDEPQPTYHCVFIDLESVHQSDSGYDLASADDYGLVKEILEEAGLRKDLIEEYYEPREIWDERAPFTETFFLPDEGPEFDS